LGDLGPFADTVKYSQAYAINASGMSVGYANDSTGYRAVRWDQNGEITELALVTQDITYDSRAVAINDNGIIVGYSSLANGESPIPVDKSRGYSNDAQRAVRWTYGSVTVLGDINPTAPAYISGYTDPEGIPDYVGHSGAVAINDSGTAIGFADKYNWVVSQIYPMPPNWTYGGIRAVRWDAGGTTATELGGLGTDGSPSNGDHSNAGYAWDQAYAINNSGTIVGSAGKYEDSLPAFPVHQGTRAVRWDAGSTLATELGTLGTDANNTSYSEAYAINASGTAVGYANKYDAGIPQGTRAVRWGSSGTAAIELGNLGTDSNNVTNSQANAINSNGIIVGFAEAYDTSGNDLGQRAVYWALDGIAVDLNTLIDPDSGWILTEADGISDTGWIDGIGMFDSDGAGGHAAYQRLFLIPVPEPGGLCLLAMGAMAILRRRKRSL
jgi:hypothetical protein